MAPQILIADDERLSRFLTQSILEKLGFQVELCDDGRGAVEAEATGDFAAIFMDCQMPNMDGFQATAAIRRQQVERGGAHTPIIGLSARAMDGDDEVAIAKGMDTYITKPQSIRKVRAALEQVGVAVDAAQSAAQ
jgi:CheY-like chemotaxis protein